MSLCNGNNMQQVYDIFIFLEKSGWNDLYAYGYKNGYTLKLIPELLINLYDSSWAQSLENFKQDIINAKLKYLSVVEMRNIYLDTQFRMVNNTFKRQIKRQISENDWNYAEDIYEEKGMTANTWMWVATHYGLVNKTFFYIKKDNSDKFVRLTFCL